MKAKYSKGPWKAHLNAPSAVIPGHLIKTDDGVQRPIASLWVGGGISGKPTQIANAHLIAAAPELLEHLRYALKFMRGISGNSAQVRDIEAVIAKAEGRAA